MRIPSTALLFTTLLLSISSAHAQSVQDPKFADVAALYDSMSPAQKQAVLNAAASRQSDLQKLSPAEQEALAKQLRATADTIKMDQIDPAKLNTSKIKTTEQTRNDLDSYQKKYAQGKIHNAAVKRPDVRE